MGGTPRIDNTYNFQLCHVEYQLGTVETKFYYNVLHGLLNTRPYFLHLEASSKRPNDFSLIGRKPNEILQFK